MRLSAVAASVVTLILVAPAYAGSCGSGSHAHSLQNRASEYFAQMDTNGDDKVSKSEFDASPLATVVKSFEALKPDESGVVTKEAFIEDFVKAHGKQETEA
jgi:hypothetical protein